VSQQWSCIFRAQARSVALLAHFLFGARKLQGILRKISSQEETNEKNPDNNKQRSDFFAGIEHLGADLFCHPS
jgi:hypothetical protein